MLKWIKNIGPGTLVAAAFIGPGTVTMCTIAGAQFGFSLLWAMLLSIIATIVLQEMAARVGILTQKGLVEVITDQITSPVVKKLVVLLILGAVVVGNAAYEAGNVSGASLGLAAIVGDSYSGSFPLLIGGIAFIMLSIGNYKVLERVLIGLVIIMSGSFLITAIITAPSLKAILSGMLVPTAPAGSRWIIVGIIGTTVVPYNLFLHAALVKEKWKSKSDLGLARNDVLVSIALGGLVSMAIMVAAASIVGGKVSNVMDLAQGLMPLYGQFAIYFLGVGMFAAGITSAITAPLAGAYVAQSCFGWDASLKSLRFKSVWMLILAVGVLSSTLNFKAIQIITFAQVANGLLLPIVALFLLWVVNKPTVLGTYKNTLFQNLISIIIVIVAVLLGAKGIYGAIA